MPGRGQRRRLTARLRSAARSFPVIGQQPQLPFRDRRRGVCRDPLPANPGFRSAIGSPCPLTMTGRG